jgi:hypothetical protein
MVAHDSIQLLHDGVTPVPSIEDMEAASPCPGRLDATTATSIGRTPCVVPNLDGMDSAGPCPAGLDAASATSMGRTWGDARNLNVMDASAHGTA